MCQIAVSKVNAFSIEEKDDHELDLGGNGDGRSKWTSDS